MKHKKGIYEKYIKRSLDFIISLLILIVLFPVFIFLYIGVLIKLGRPVIFKQKRPGKNEKVFTLYKFRTMTDEKNEKGELLPDKDRVTTFGKILRKTSLDELPELINILKGDMSLVGPRPLLVKYIPFYTEEEKLRHDVRPGLTGFAQINGRNNLEWDKRLEKDVEYVNNITFKGDLKIMIKTLNSVYKQDDIVITSESHDLDVVRQKRGEKHEYINN